MSEHVKPYEQEAAKKEQISKMFDNIAPKYDLLNSVLSLGIDKRWRKKMLRRLEAHKPQHLLDIATGTADVAIAAASKFNVPQVTGVDISPKMLEVGQGKIDKKGLEKVITLSLGDSENLPFESNTFDAITVAFGVRNFESLEKGLAEMYRVLKPNGKMLILELSRPSMFPFKQIYNFYFRYILPLVGRVTSKDQKAYTYLYESVQAFPDGKDFVKLLDHLQFKTTTCVPLSLGICSIYEGTK